MPDHAAPRGDETVREDDGEEERAEDADAPHADEIEDERDFRLAAALHDALDDDRHAVERLRNGDHAQYRRAEFDDGGVRREEPHEDTGKCE